MSVAYGIPRTGESIGRTAVHGVTSFIYPDCASDFTKRLSSCNNMALDGVGRRVALHAVRPPTKAFNRDRRQRHNIPLPRRGPAIRAAHITAGGAARA